MLTPLLDQKHAAFYRITITKLLGHSQLITLALLMYSISVCVPHGVCKIIARAVSLMCFTTCMVTPSGISVFRGLHSSEEYRSLCPYASRSIQSAVKQITWVVVVILAASLTNLPSLGRGILMMFASVAILLILEKCFVRLMGNLVAHENIMVVK